MAVITEHDRSLIDGVVERWREACLIGDHSLLFDSESTWSSNNAEELFQRFNENLLMGEGSFEDKFKEQLGDKPEVVRLAGEIVAIHFLFVSNVTGGRKRELTNTVLGWAGDELPPDSDLAKAMNTGIGSGGPGFNMRRWAHLAYFFKFVRRIKVKAPDERRELLADPWEFEAWLDSEQGEAEQMRHILLHLLFPQHFERIASTGNKREIRSTFEGLVEDPPEDLDRCLWEIRQRAEELLPGQEVDFYWTPLGECWDPADEEVEDASVGVTDLGALEHKRQVILFGPPGTGKTHSAKDLAGRLLRHQALQRWGAVTYLERLAVVEDLIEKQVRRLQLHPAYSYEEFIRGMRLEGGHTAPRDGYFLKLAAEVEGTSAPDGLKPLPWVLVLDEINRADLSRLFGEVFSVLEDRNAEVELPITDPALAPRINMPDDLFVIGTMNLIDQSVEQLDFALRRRFLWLPRGFERDVIPEVVEQQWRETDLEAFPWIGRYGWEYIAEEVNLLADQARRLNYQVKESRWLGQQYEVGHTYFFDIVGFLRRWRRLKSKGPRPNGYLWSGRGKPQAPLVDLWRHSLRPLLAEYLAGIDPVEREEELTQLQEAFLTIEGS